MFLASSRETEYSAFEHFCSTLPKGSNPLMAMWTAYFDDSGTHKDSSVAVAACLLSDYRRWARVDQEWHDAANDERDGFDVFHMNYFHSGQKEFWNWDADKKNRVLGNLIEIIGKNVLFATTTAVVKDDYDRLVAGKLREKLGDNHYTFAVQACLYDIQRYRVIIHMGSQEIQYIFDQMTKGKHEIVDVFEDVWVRGLGEHFGIEAPSSGLAFQDKRRFLPLQPTDILAWESYCYIRDCQLPKESDRQKPRVSFESLIKKPNPSTRFFDKTNLPEFVEGVTKQYELIGWENAPRGAFF